MIAILSYFFGGLFVTNSIPHIVNGTSGRAFQTPFAKPSGEGLSSSAVNVLWGFFNIMVGYLLIMQVGDFDIHLAQHVAAVELGALLIALFSARHFGRFHGGNSLT